MTEAAPITTVQELMQRDPLHLSDQDITTIIEHARKTRITFKTTGSVPRAATAKPAKAIPANRQVSNLDFSL